MRDDLEKLQVALQNLKDATTLKKGAAAETALLATVDLMEKMVEEIEKLRQDKERAEQ